MKKLTILCSAITFLLLSSIGTYASRTMSQSTQKQTTNTEQVASESTDKCQSEQEQSPVDTRQETDSETNKLQSKNYRGY